MREELIKEARKFLATPNLGKDMARELDKALIHIRRLADALEVAMIPHAECEASGERAGAQLADLKAALEAAEARVKELEAGVTGRIVTASFEDGKTRVECSLEDCECPEHDWPVLPAGTYITVRLDEDCHVGLFRVRVHTLPVESEGE